MTVIKYYAYEYLHFLCYASPNHTQFSTAEHMKMKYHKSIYSRMGQKSPSTHTDHTGR